MRYQTFKEWKLFGFHVMKGERSNKRDKNGNALFSQNQVERNYDPEYDDEEERCKDAHYGFDGW